MLVPNDARTATRCTCPGHLTCYPTVLLLQVHLQQIQTGVFLASSSQKFQRPIAGQQEIFGRSKKDDWTATQGVFFPSRSAA